MLGLRIAIPVFAITTVLVVPVQATTSYYAGTSTEASFNAAIGGLTLLNPTMTFSGDGTSGLFNASGTGIDFLGSIFGNTAGFTIASGKLNGTDADEIVRINFPVANPVYAFGFHISFMSASFANWCIELTPGSCNYSVFVSSPSSSQFFGIVSDTPITAPLYIRHSSGAPIVVLNDFEAYGGSQSPSVPEPRTMLLVGIGLIILPLVRRKIVRQRV